MSGELAHICRGKSLRCVRSAGPNRDRAAIFRCLECSAQWSIEYVRQGVADELAAVVRKNGQIQQVLNERRLVSRKGAKTRRTERKKK